jgi:hypothetical protein
VSIPDARRSGSTTSWKERRYAPKHAAVWVRVQGNWRRGRIIEWVREIDKAGWDCVIVAEDRQEPTLWQGRFRYDARAIRPRHGERAPF